MYIDRRKMMQGMAAGFGAALGGGLVPDLAQAAPLSKTNPKRVIFFMQNQGFDPATAIPAGMKNSGSLAKAKLPEPIEYWIRSIINFKDTDRHCRRSKSI